VCQKAGIYNSPPHTHNTFCSRSNLLEKELLIQPQRGMWPLDEEAARDIVITHARHSNNMICVITISCVALLLCRARVIIISCATLLLCRKRAVATRFYLVGSITGDSVSYTKYTDGIRVDRRDEIESRPNGASRPPIMKITAFSRLRYYIRYT
jgi:hypothetical protein